IQLHLLLSTMPPARSAAKQPAEPRNDLTRSAREWVNQTVDALPASPWVIPVIVRGLNVVAEFRLGFTQPFSRLDLKLEALLEESRDVPSLNYAIAQLGQGTPKNSPFMASLQRSRLKVTTNIAFLDWVISVQREQKQGERAKAVMAYNLR